MRLRVINCDRAVPDGGGYEGNCPFYDPEYAECRHPSKVGVDPACGPHGGTSVGYGCNMPEWCPLREGAVTVYVDEEASEG